MRIKHWQGYGNVEAKRIQDKNCTLHVRVTGNHEWGIRRDDIYDLFNWLVLKFDKTIPDVTTWMRMRPDVFINDGYITDDRGCDVETCDYYFVYRK